MIITQQSIARIYILYEMCVCVYVGERPCVHVAALSSRFHRLFVNLMRSRDNPDID